ncbi:carboxylesterase family protein [Maricaulis sp.]|uniref:carboxylesterase/lipase family protein n=1 Tax=Maricaulis sp. TaxID=1486257 RepID=UPI00262ED45D|nr:carboxylesterase family protein [Maricaulis sp.]MDF1769796.1 carboxylesterase family protein [Maricaulis sp.]
MRLGHLALGLAALAVSACSSEEEAAFTPVPAADLVRTIGQGELVGFETEGGAAAWMAVPYAAPPVGELRWRAPRPPLAFQARREALEAGSVCPQVTNNLSAGELYETGELIGAEDCLTLDIYAPRDVAADEALPVMMWIHGGANTWGSSSAYDGSALASQQGVIIVSVQYRLGPLGFLAHPALRADAEIDDDAAANFALLDLVAALHWISGNIETFGGDPNRVTVFGESAGAYNIAGLMAAPQARGLFHRAIMQSGGTASVPLGIAEQGGGNDAVAGLAAGRAIAGEGATGADLRGASLDVVYAAYRDEDGELTSMPRMIEDGVTLPEGGILAAAEAPGGFADVPLMSGTNRDEMKLYTVFDPRLTRRLGPLVWPKGEDRYEAAVEYPSRIWRYNAVDGLLNRLAANGRSDLWAYRFDWDEGGSVLVTDTGVLLGAAHAMEIPFVFNHFELFGAFDSVLFNDRNEVGRVELAETMGAYWAQFAASGMPGDGIGMGPQWPQWTDTGAALRFDTRDDGGNEVFSRTESPLAIASDLAADGRVDDETRCQIARGIVARQPSLADAFAGALTCDS